MENSDPAAAAEPQPDVQPIPIAEPGDPALLTPAVGPQLSDVMTEEEFADVFASLFPMAAGLYAMRDPPELQSLMHAADLPTARPAFGALYRCANRYDWLRWLIEKDQMWLADAVLIGGFSAQVYVGVTTELRQRAEAREAWRRKQERDNASRGFNQRGNGNRQDNAGPEDSQRPPPDTAH